MKIKIFPLGDNALTIDFGSEISLEYNNRALNLALYFERHPFPGLIETIPAYASVTVFYDVPEIHNNFPGERTAFETVKGFVVRALQDPAEFQSNHSRLFEIPVCFQSKFAPDLEFAAAYANLSADRFIEIFLGSNYRVFMLGFLPGFSYLGELDANLALPRKPQPRTKVPAGSVGIAGRQTGIYSLESPGGWQIIGQTPIKVFTPEAERPALFQAGDLIKFYAVEEQDFNKIQAGQNNVQNKS